VPFVSPVTVIALEVAVAVIPFGLDVAVYNVIALPPSDTGAVKFTVACAFSTPLVVTTVGAPGTVAGVTSLEDADASPVPTAFVAVTVKV
jgi:hypothetical protein